ncbi:unnamed protein product, partial [Ectocarpus fasciculatus]
MFGNSGGDVGYGAQQQGYQTRSRGRGRDGPPEGQLVEGDLFGNPKHQSFRPTDPPAGVAPRGAYHDATAGGGGGVGGNAFRNNGAGAGGYGQTPAAAQPSPFARGPSPMNASFSGAGGGSAAGPGYSAGGYNDPGQTAPPPQQQQQHGFGPRVGFSSEVALVPVEASGNSRGRNVMDDDDDDDIPTRSLADVPDDVRDGGVLFGGGEGLRSRRAGGGGRGGGGGDRMGGGLDGIGGYNAAPDTQRATWVVVWGVPPGKSNQVLIRFLQFGDVVEQRGHPGSNWLYFKYATRLQAEKALAAGHGSRLTDTVMLGVQRVPDDEVHAGGNLT